MANSPYQRLKLLYLMKILLEKTDEDNPMTVADLINSLAAYDIKAERKSIYSDLELLRHYGLDIEVQRSKKTGYYIASRQFELPELKLLVDAVQSCSFVTAKKSEKLIKKLSSLTSNGQAKLLQRQVFVADQPKTINETVYYSIDQIHNAINEKKKISFKYFDYDVRKNVIYRKQGGTYKTTPIALCWKSDNYYLITYNAKHDSLTHYRVDRMSNVVALDEEANKIDKNKFSIAEHVKRVFGMFEGEIVRAKLSFHNTLVNAVLDHFGKDVIIIPSKEDWFEITVDVSVSPVLLSWIFNFGELALIVEPDTLIEAMKERIELVRNNYI